MKRSLMLFTAMASLAIPSAAPVVALAQDRPTAQEREERRAEANGGEAPALSPQQRQERPQEQQPPREPRPDRPDRPQQPDRPDQPQQPDRPNRPDRPDRPNRPDEEQRPDRPNRPDRPDRPDRPQQPDRPDTRGDRREERRDDRRQDRREDRFERREDRRDYREFRSRFNHDQWRRNWDRDRRSNWWRNDRRFRGWSGVRLGFYFAPGYGYYSVPRSYYGQSFREGQYLPSIFWRYRLDDYRTYGLGYPPQGTRWVYVDNSIYLIDEYDGYIIEVIRSAWSW